MIEVQSVFEVFWWMRWVVGFITAIFIHRTVINSYRTFVLFDDKPFNDPELEKMRIAFPKSEKWYSLGTALLYFALAWAGTKLVYDWPVG